MEILDGPGKLGTLSSIFNPFAHATSIGERAAGIEAVYKAIQTNHRVSAVSNPRSIGFSLGEIFLTLSHFASEAWFVFHFVNSIIGLANGEQSVSTNNLLIVGGLYLLASSCHWLNYDSMWQKLDQYQRSVITEVRAVNKPSRRA